MKSTGCEHTQNFPVNHLSIGFVTGGSSGGGGGACHIQGVWLK